MHDLSLVTNRTGEVIILRSIQETGFSELSWGLIVRSKQEIYTSSDKKRVKQGWPANVTGPHQK